jgi:hypothetical protein
MGDTAKQFSLQNFRPEGFGYPTGLNVAIAANTVVDYLVVAGGGGGGHTRAGGGGAGGFLTGSGYSLSQSTSHTIIVGAGGVISFTPLLVMEHLIPILTSVVQTLTQSIKTTK